MVIHSEHLSLKFLPKKATATYSASLSPAVSKKNYKRAVDRNKLKRRTRVIFRKFSKNLPIGMYVLHIKKGSLEMPFKDLENELKKLLLR